MDLHLRYWKLVAEYYEGDTTPFFVEAYANDGHTYAAEPVETKRCRCAKWNRDTYRYEENGMYYRRETWTGPGEGIPVVIEEGRRIK